jgi:hypothetical protein
MHPFSTQNTPTFLQRLTCGEKGKLPCGEKWKWGVKFRRDVGLLAGRRDSILLRE